MARKEETFTYKQSETGKVLKVILLSKISIDDVMEHMIRVSIGQIMGKCSYDEQEGGSILEKKLKNGVID